MVMMHNRRCATRWDYFLFIQPPRRRPLLRHQLHTDNTTKNIMSFLLVGVSASSTAGSFVYYPLRQACPLKVCIGHMFKASHPARVETARNLIQRTVRLGASTTK